MNKKSDIIFETLNSNQDKYKKIIDKCDLTFCIGPAGSAKSFIPSVLGVSYLISKKYKNIIICRPTVECGQSLGYLPGGLEEKLYPYVQPIMNIIELYYPDNNININDLIKSKKILIKPVQYLRGDTFDDSFIIFDEFQNCTYSEIKTALTRIGDNSKAVVTGDPGQIDLKRDQISGLMDTIKRIDTANEICYKFDYGHYLDGRLDKDIDKPSIHNSEYNVGYMSFGLEDIVRSPLVAMLEKVLKD